MRQTKDHKFKFSQKKKLIDLKFVVEKETELLIFLLEKMPQKSRNDVKVLLRDKHIFIEGKASSQFKV